MQKERSSDVSYPFPSMLIPPLQLFLLPCLPVQLLQVWSQETSECWIGRHYRALLEFVVMPILPPAQQERIDVMSPHSIFLPQTKPCLAALRFGKNVAWSKTADLEIYCPFSWGWYVIHLSPGFVILKNSISHISNKNLFSLIYTDQLSVLVVFIWF